MLDTEQRLLNARKFAEDWKGKGREKADDQTFWNSFLMEVLGVERVFHEIEYQKPVKAGRSTKWIDAYIASSKVLIEQKSLGIDLTKPGRQSDDENLTPYEQAVRYASYLPPAEYPDFIITSNFESFLIYDRRNDPGGLSPVSVRLEELPDQLSVFDFITDPINAIIERQVKISKEAAGIIGRIYALVREQYVDPDRSGADLAALMVRILFCLYAEDAGLFEKNLFYNYLKDVPAGEGRFREALLTLFKVLDTPKEQRDPYLGATLAQFPYVNGGLFAGEIEIPIFTDEIKREILDDSSHRFDWAGISPVIFGSIFESILSGEQRRAGGMHYTSVQNIRKVIDPLFLDGIVAKLREAGEDKARLRALQDEIASLSFLDPACGSGNFLTQTYIELRGVENEILRRLVSGGQLSLELEDLRVKVNVGQFFGIEINDFAVNVANAALWIADHQSNIETSGILSRRIVNLPLVDYHHIVCGNALRMDWGALRAAEGGRPYDFIMGNPPFLGSKYQTDEQRREIESVCFGVDGKPIKGVGTLDYVCGWYYKAAQLMQGTDCRAAFVSTNSICQGESVSTLWGALLTGYACHIDFGYRTFKWESEAKGMAAVHCVIVGFSVAANDAPRVIFGNDNTTSSFSGLSRESKELPANINGYLIFAPNIFVGSRAKPLCGMPPIGIGNKPIDGGNYLFTREGKDAFLKTEPRAEKWFRPWIGSDEFINGYTRFCLWLGDCPPNELRTMPEAMRRVEAVRAFRLASKSAPTRKLAETPTRFHVENMPKENYIVIPKVSSERRKYIPIGMLTPETFASDLVFLIPGATLYHFGILTSNVHNAWMRAVAGRLKSDYRYSKDIVYNNFPWPEANEAQQAEIAALAQGVLDARLLFPNSSLADLYDPLTMPPELTRAHQALDKAVMKLYGGWGKWQSEADCVADLMTRYQALVEKGK